LKSQGDFVVLLNDDTEVVSDDWLEALVAPLEEADVGLTGAKLLYEDGSIQHGGHLYASGSRPPHPLHAYRWWPDGTGLSGDLIINRECSGVTAACAALRREVYQEIGGLSEIVPVNFNDVDLSLKVRHVGRRVLWIADCVVKHFESKSRVQSKARDFEIEFLERRWPDSFVRDRYAPWLSYKETVRPHAYKRWEE
jgi:GT2 family glycosyltransferase